VELARRIIVKYGENLLSLDSLSASLGDIAHTLKSLGRDDEAREARLEAGEIALRVRRSTDL
jgi:hypothetical protein